MPRLNKAFFFLFVASLTFASCKTSTSPADNTTTPSSLSGTLVYDIPSADGDIGVYSFANHRETLPFKYGRCPSWTPNGDILYEEYNSSSDGKWKIVQIAPNGTNKRILLDSKMFSLSVKKSPKMSRDGGMVCFNYWFGNTGDDLYTGHATLILQSNGQLLAVDSLFDGSWMPDGSLVLSSTVDELYGEFTFYADGLYRLSADGSAITAIGSGLVKPKHPAVSPDGKQIAFAMNKHIWVINADGTGLRQVTTGDKEETHPCWSPDGKTIACISFGTFEVSYYNALAAVPASAATPIDLTNDSPYWVRDPNQSTTSSGGRLNPNSSIAWK
jgi:TolB protein